jgi:hydrogenase/urease accessory protein HupE
MINTQRFWNRLPNPNVRCSQLAMMFLVLPMLLLLATMEVEAHDPGLSAADLRIEDSRVVANLTLARGDVESIVAMDSDRDGEITPAEFENALPELEALASSSLELRVDGRLSSVSGASVRPGESNAIHFHVRFDVGTGSELSVSSLLIGRLARGHRQYLSVVDERGNKLGERILDAGDDLFSLKFDAATAAAPQSVSEFLLLGIEHILTGYDHLVFLLGLLIAGASFRAAAKIITSFTVAHSITLALATLDVIRISPGIVEPLIAVSIVYVGIENTFRRETKRRWLLTFCFGFVHGFGFASVLSELGIGSEGMAGAAIPLLSFNLGVELGQVAIAAAALPLIWKLRNRPSFVARFVPVCSVLVAVAGGFWLIERTMLK